KTRSGFIFTPFQSEIQVLNLQDVLTIPRLGRSAGSKSKGYRLKILRRHGVSTSPQSPAFPSFQRLLLFGPSHPFHIQYG
ncbi:MAG: hypothetical protein LBJ22_02795, partial [Synergistaceae bacterium]|nr:hypothetical protein [Synergistaceae bacterium]